MSKKNLFLLLFLVLMGSYVLPAEQRVANFMVRYDLDSDSDVYCVVTGQTGSPYGAATAGRAPIKTTGSSVTIDAVTAGTNPFLDVLVDDVIMVTFSTSTAPVLRVVVTKASNDQITVETAVDLSAGYAFTWKKTTCGSAATSGWIDISGMRDVNITIEYNQGDLGTGVDLRFEGKAAALDSNPVILYPGDISATNACGGGVLSSGYCTLATVDAGIVARLALTDVKWNYVRIAVNRNGTDTSDATTDRESINGYVEGWMEE